MTTSVPQATKALVDAEIKRCIAIAEAKYGRTFRMPSVIYTKRGTTAGTANDRKYQINLNAVLLNENGIKFIYGRVGNGTVTHEFAHLVDGIVNPETRERGLVYNAGRMTRAKRNVHGTPWKNIMRLFGVRNPTRCHNYDVANSRVKKATGKKHAWVCGCGKGKVILTDYKHNQQKVKAPSGYGVYSRGHSPNKCGVYTYKGIEGSKPVVTAIPQPKPQSGTKLDQACQTYREYYFKDRAIVITAIMESCAMSWAGAQTYYYKAKQIVG